MAFSWVAADGGYGQDRALLRALDDAGEVFVIDVHRDQRIFLEEPRKKERNRGSEEPKIRSLRVDEWVAQQPGASWQEVWLRQRSQGELRAQALRCSVWVLEGKIVQLAAGS